jgi:hypothetical protein
MRIANHLKVLVAAVIVASVPSVTVEAAEADAKSLKKRPFTVIAVVDTGINPYHVDFRAPELSRHPSTYISGFPRSARALNLSLSAATYEEAVARDKKKWDAVDPTKLYWVPGTNIVGAIGTSTESPENFLDQDETGPGHGTAVASLAGGRVHGPGTDDVLIVVVNSSTNDMKLHEWAARQPWIDVVTHSHVGCCPPTPEHSRASRIGVESGKLVCFGTGNFVVPVWAAGTQGPSWILSVGAASQTTRGEHAYTSFPTDVLGLSGVKIATHRSIDGEGFGIGTSMATPNVCGQAARVISEIRGVLGDYSEGAAAGLATGRKLEGRHLEDGCLDRAELEDAIQATAVPAQPSPPDPNDPVAIPAAPIVGFVRGGYGIVDHDSADAAIDVLLGRTPRPERSLEDAWITQTDSVRDALYGSPPDPVGCL